MASNLRKAKLARSEDRDVNTKMIYLALTATTLAAFTNVAAAQGTSGGHGVVASIPGSVVRGHEQGHGLISILSGSNPPGYRWDSTGRTRRIQRDAFHRQTGK